MSEEETEPNIVPEVQEVESSEEEVVEAESEEEVEPDEEVEAEPDEVEAEPEVKVESVVNTDLQERVKVLEERLEKLILFIKTGNSMPESYII